jgi:hypothetical protein
MQYVILIALSILPDEKVDLPEVARDYELPVTTY